MRREEHVGWMRSGRGGAANRDIVSVTNYAHFEILRIARVEDRCELSQHFISA